MVGQCGRRRLVVVGNRSILVNQRDAQVLSIEATQERDGLLLLVEGGSNELGFLRQVGTRGIRQGVLHKERTQHRKRHDNRHGADKDRHKNAVRQRMFSLGGEDHGLLSDAVAAVSSPSAPSPAEGSAKR